MSDRICPAYSLPGLLRGLLTCDVIGFHTEEYKHNFIETCEHSLGAKVSDQAIEYKEHQAQLGVFIVDIDPEKFDNAPKDGEVIKRIHELEEQYKDKTVIVGVDRLDYTKGLVQKLQGYDQFLNEHPELKKNVVLIQVAVPSRENVKEYQEREMEIATLVGRICGNRATPDGVPLIYIHRSISFPELTALYRISKACLITSRRDRMNLVASEYIACQEGRWGVLVLSELAGAASFMHHGSITFHPSSSHKLSNAIHQAVTMDETEKKKRYRSLHEFIDTHNSAKWGQAFVDTLAQAVQSA